MVKFNLNSEVAIELKKQTLAIIREKICGDEATKDEYMKYCVLPHVITNNDKEYLWIQMWEAMYYFGDKMIMGSDPKLGLDIFIKDESLETVNEF